MMETCCLPLNNFYAGVQAKCAPPVASKGLAFKPLTAENRPLLDKYFLRYPQRVAGYTYSEMAAWNQFYAYEWAEDGRGTLFIKGAPEADGLKHFMQPVGVFDETAQASFLKMLRDGDYTAKVMSVSGEFISQHHDFVQAHFALENDPGKANYIYRTRDLAGLAGKAYAKKRNLIAQARQMYEWRAEPVTALNIRHCLTVLEAVQNQAEDETEMNLAIVESRGQENMAAHTALRQFSMLDYKGLLITVAGQPAGFALYEDIGHRTAVIAFEKALRQYKGMYQILNQETAKVIAAKGLAFINREEDMNLAGLRQAKDSYHPCEMVPSYTLRL